MNSLLYLLPFSIVIGAIGILIYLYNQLNFWSKKNIPRTSLFLTVKTFYQVFGQRKSLPEIHQINYNAFSNARYFGTLNFFTPTITIRDPEIIKDVLVKNFDHFTDHQSFVDEKTDPVFGKNLISLKGERWREIRNTLSPSFTAVKMKFMFDLVSMCAKSFIEYFNNHPEEAECFEGKDIFTKYTNDVIASVAFGISVNSLENKNNEFYTKGKDATSFNFFRIIKMFLFIFFPKLMKLMRQKVLPNKTDNFFRTVIKDTLRIREEKKIIRPDMIHLLMEARDKENGIDLSIDDIIAQAFLFFFAGFETSSTFMCFLAHELAVNEQIQEKLRNEIDNLTADNEISYDIVNKMTYLDMVISETLRKYPPAAATDRICVKSFSLPQATPDTNKYTIEPNSQIFIPIYALQNDPKYFPEPEKFDPERFSDENKDKINPYTYLPFGLGPRKCIGNRFALMEIKILFVYILKNFVLEKTEKTKDPIEFDNKFAMSIKGGCWIKLREKVSFY
ncbi:cytochrome P450 9e2-like [Leptopilina boulardi]|uniref:cytochrome P450 9e2-like n=1 Tax=Leptopilina boulardi TaxID=63433 RepID=UPI0021F620A4|nr:cytochrome P450 9e2-like [Leptopilina boulardi]